MTAAPSSIPQETTAMLRRVPKPSLSEEAALSLWMAEETDRILARAAALDLSPVDLVMHIEALEDEVADLKRRLARYEAAA